MTRSKTNSAPTYQQSPLDTTIAQAVTSTDFQTSNTAFAAIMTQIDSLSNVAPHINIDKSTLNLDSNGKPLTMRSAMTGPNRDAWIQADEEEFERFFSHPFFIPTSLQTAVEISHI